MDSSHGKRGLEFLLVGFPVFFRRVFYCRFDVLYKHLKMANKYIPRLEFKGSIMTNIDVTGKKKHSEIPF